MKTKVFSFLALAVLFIGASFAASYTRQPARVTVFEASPSYDVTGVLAHMSIDARVIQPLVNDADATDIRGKSESVSVNFDLLDPTLASGNITASGKTVTYPQLAALMKQAVLDRANAAGVQ